MFVRVLQTPIKKCGKHPSPTPNTHTPHTHTPTHTPHTCGYVQDQYVFIHDAILETVTCGDTQIEASNLRMAMNKLQEALPGETNYTQQFTVSGL